MKVPCYILDTVGQNVLYWSYACHAEGNSDFLNLALPSTSSLCTLPCQEAMLLPKLLFQMMAPLKRFPYIALWDPYRMFSWSLVIN